jgi:hypothetical protein
VNETVMMPDYAVESPCADCGHSINVHSAHACHYRDSDSEENCKCFGYTDEPMIRIPLEGTVS